jgi:hypothetical protein
VEVVFFLSINTRFIKKFGSNLNLTTKRVNPMILKIHNINFRAENSKEGQLIRVGTLAGFIT